MAGEKAKVLNCVQCGGAVEWRAPGFTVTLVCGSCGSVLDVSNPEIQLLIQSQEKTRLKPLIPLGARGKIRGETYEMIGFMQRADGSGQYKWREYLLFNPYIGYRWLVESDGHWSYVRSTKQKPVRRGNTAQYLKNTYKLFLTGEAQVLYVLGEFYWRVKIGDRVSVQDFIFPPEMLSREWDDTEEVWSIGEYLEPEEVQAAFGLKSVPLRSGVAPHQPAPQEGKYQKVFWVAVLLTVLSFVVQLGTNRNSEVQSIFQSDVTAESLRSQPPLPPFLVSVKGGAPEYSLRTQASGMTNGPVFLDVSFKNRGNGETIKVVQIVEAATNGLPGRAEIQTIPELPDGDYELRLEPTTGILPLGSVYSVELFPKRSQWSNFLGAALLLWMYPLWLKFRRWSFETSRWMQSDFAEE